MDNWTTTRARIAALSRSRTPDDPELIAARRDLKAERLAAHVAATVDTFPPLTGAQLDRIAALLRPTTMAGGGNR